MRLTIERMRTLVLAAAALLIVALVAFLGVARWKARSFIREIPRRLGANIQQEANGVTYTQTRGGHIAIKIHASKAVQFKQGGRLILHEVWIELFGEDGKRVDRIAGEEFEYDQKNGIATAAGPVEITLMRPQETMAASSRAGPNRLPKSTPLANAAKTASQSEIHVKTSGLTFDQKSGIATTAQRVEFAIAQGTGSSVGASFDSEKGQLVLDHSVELDVHRGPQRVVLRARHAEFERDNLLCRLEGAESSFQGGQASAGKADLLFRPDGSAVRLDASDGILLTTANSARIAAPRGTLEFDEHNQPRHGRLEGGATMDSDSNGRQVHGSAPTADLAFTPQGLLRVAHLERGVLIHSDQTSPAQNGETVRVSRDWRSPVADVDFRSPRKTGKRQVEVASVTGSGGVTIAGQTQRGSGPVIPSRLAADRVVAAFGDGQVLTSAVGSGHASLEQTTSSGAKQTTNGDRIEASFAPPEEKKPQGDSNAQPAASSSAGEQIQSATVAGNVVLVQQPAVRAQAPSKPGGTPGAPLRATAGRAVYESAGGEWIHLLVNPRVENGVLQLAADKLDVSQASGDAFAHGHVKASWLGGPEPGSKPAAAAAVAAPAAAALGGQGPAHVIADEAQLQQAGGQATFQGHARLWQQSNSISAPVIVLDRVRQTLVAHSSNPSDPVRVLMLSGGGALAGKPGSARQPRDARETTHSAPSVIRVRGGDLKYSEAERKAVLQGGAAGNVVAETGTAIVVSSEVELLLLPPGNHAGPDGSAGQIDRITATGHVTVASQGRRGTGDRLVYSSATDEYVLTGTSSNLPRLTDPVRGAVSGVSLIFNSRDDSVSIEGNGQKTSTETMAPK